MTLLRIRGSALVRERASRAMLLTLVMMALHHGAGLMLDLLLNGEDPAIFYALQCMQEVMLWGLPALLLRPFRARGVPMREGCGGACLAALLLGAAVQLALAPVTACWTQWTGAPTSSLSMPENEAQWLLAILALCVAPALCEETFFRGGMLTALAEELPVWAALALSTLLFALMHGSLAGLPAHLTVSLLAGLCMLRWGRLRVSMLLHLGYNVMGLLAPALPVSLATTLPLLLMMLAAALWMAGDIRWHGRYGPMGLSTAVLCAVTLLCAALAYVPDMIR
ncbi:MAG: lysostaphin resistance A-like protein [Aristaeellaceae bacterium]